MYNLSNCLFTILHLHFFAFTNIEYFSGFAVGTFVAGIVSDMFGRKRSDIKCWVCLSLLYKDPSNRLIIQTDLKTFQIDFLHNDEKQVNSSILIFNFDLIFV